MQKQLRDLQLLQKIIDYVLHWLLHWSDVTFLGEFFADFRETILISFFLQNREIS